MQQINARITVNPERLDRPSRPIFARRFSSIVAAIDGIPEDCYSVTMRVFHGSGFYSIPVGIAPDGGSVCYIIGTCFPEVGESRYEIAAYDGSGNYTALGWGTIRIEEWTAGEGANPPTESVQIDTIQDADGVSHTLMAVPDGMGGYTVIVDG